MKKLNLLKIIERVERVIVFSLVILLLISRQRVAPAPGILIGIGVILFGLSALYLILKKTT